MRTPATAASQGTSVLLNLVVAANKVHPMNSSNSSSSSGGGVAGSIHDQQALALEGFQRHVSERFYALASAEGEDLLSVAWVGRVLEATLSCEAEFRARVPCPSPQQASSKPRERLAFDFFERSVKALDICNAIRDGIEQVRLWQRHVEIVICALDSRHRTLGEAQFRRARKALNDLTIAMADEKEACLLLAHRNRSFGRSSRRETASVGHFRSLSWSVSRSWSAGRQLQAMSASLVAPRNAETAATSGFSIPAYTMNNVFLLAMWTLVAAIPCQDRGLQTHVTVPRHFAWAAPLLAIYDRVMEESRKRDRRSSIGLLKEIQQIAACVRSLTDIAETVNFPLTEARDEEIKKQMLQLMHLWSTLKDGLDVLENLVREVYRRIVRIRTDVLDTLSKPISQD